MEPKLHTYTHISRSSFTFCENGLNKGCILYVDILPHIYDIQLKYM